MKQQIGHYVLLLKSELFCWMFFAPNVFLQAANSVSSPEVVNGSIGKRRGGRKRIETHRAALWLLTEGCSSQGQTAKTCLPLNPSPNQLMDKPRVRIGTEKSFGYRAGNTETQMTSKPLSTV